MRELTAQEAKEWIINRQGKDFMLYKGLIHLAHEAGLVQIDTAIVAFPTKENHETTYVKAMLTFRDGDGRETTYSAHGDASVDNVGRMIAQHCPRMAETRAIARACRTALDVGYTAFEELGDEEETVRKPARQPREDLVEEPEEAPRRRERQAEPEPPPQDREEKVNLLGPATEFTMKRIKKNMDALGKPAGSFEKLPAMNERKARTYLALLQSERTKATPASARAEAE